MKSSIKTVVKGITLGIICFTGTVAHAQQQQDNINAQEVDVETPDSVLLKGKETQEMFAVLTPSERLTLSIEDVKHDIRVTRHNGETVLHVQDADYADIALIRKTYAMIANSDSFRIENTVSDEFKNNIDLQTSGTAKEMNMNSVESGF